MPEGRRSATFPEFAGNLFREKSEQSRISLPLNPGYACYDITGPEPEARWWSITAYGPDDYLIPNPAHRYSVSKTAVVRERDGTIRVQVGGEAAGDNWIPAGSRRFSLMLRLYNPGSDVVTNPAHVALPALKKLACT